YLKGKPVEQFSKPSDIKTLTVDKLSGKLPTDQTPDNDKVTDIFAPWQVPTQSDDVHVKVKIDKVTGKLATDLTPAADVVEQTYFNVHSWQPNNPNWENPVQAWAKANGGGTSPPTTKDDLHTDANRPTIGFSSPTDGSSVSGTIQLQANPGGTQPITQVDYYVNNVSVGSATAAPWSVSLDTTTLPPGSIVIQATVTNAIGMTATQQITVSNGNTPASSAPDAVTSPSATSGQISTNQPIKISWTNPNNSNLASVVIYESTSSDPANIGTKIQTVPATVGSAGNTTVDVSKLTPNQTYYFTLHPVNTAGLENQSLTRVSAQVLP
ncbi:fibronectin type III domain-containing protein, partial [Patescibacteria group bacterium]|nr:fibronectin type III domain-containing protein [Patescibacteria group bacterium]